MKTLTILRHAKSGWDVQVERDFDRPINARGRRGAELIGQYVKRQGLPVDRIIASPAVRVTETLDLFQPAAALDALEPHWDRRIYLASAATLIDVIRDMGKDAEHLLISGHNPGLEDLVLELVPSDGGGPLREQVELAPQYLVSGRGHEIAHGVEVTEQGAHRYTCALGDLGG